MKFLFAILLFTINAKASTWQNFVEKLTETRADVETLSQEIESLQKEKQSDFEQWSQRKTDLEGQIQKEQLRSLQISEKLKRLESRVKLQSKTDPQAQKKLLAWIERFETWIPGTIPFLHESRQESLRNLKIRAQKSQEPMEFVMADFWLFVESEIKLAQSNEYKIVDIQFTGQKKKCEVARLGLQSLFVVTPDKKILKASKDAGLWKWKDIESSEDKDAILLLVQNLKNKNGSGYYHLPMDPGQVGASL